ncbi:hypothetical protein BDZ97DRAFT_812099 [Flammula alnicola]|nr:hypothetical protein BDZ97DRAFT_812099 [Flammula alnicola]
MISSSPTRFFSFLASRSTLLIAFCRVSLSSSSTATRSFKRLISSAALDLFRFAPAFVATVLAEVDGWTEAARTCAVV